MAAIIPFIPIAMAAVSAASESQAADDRYAEARKAKIQYKIKAGQVEASAQREGANRLEEAAYIASRAQAVAASSGAGAMDPTVLKIISGIEAKGAYGAAVAKYEGSEQARSLNEQGDAVGREGKADYTAAKFKMASNAMSSFGDAYQAWAH